MRALTIVLVGFALMFFSTGALAASPADPPAGIIPTNMALPRLLALHKIALGHSEEVARTERWLYSKGGLTGTQTSILSGDDYREDTTLGPFHTAQGSYRGQQWHQDANGLTLLGSGLHRRDDIDEQALAGAGKPGSGVSLLGIAWAPSEAYVVKVDPPGGRVEYIFFDASSYRVIRTERAFEDRKVVDTYDDFRNANGSLRAWHIHETDGRQFNERDWQLQSIDTTTPIRATVFVPPPSDTSHLILSTPKVVLPGRIFADRIILTAQIGARRVAFQLDSGASQILLDQSVANALGLRIYGKETEITAGTYTAQQALIPRLVLNGVTMQNLAVMTAPFQQWENNTTPVAGLLGFDFLATCIVHIDYQNGEADALDPASFKPPAGAFALAARLDDGVPVIPVKIAGASSENFVLDTGADRSLLFSHFVAAHPKAVADQGLGQEFEEAYPYLNDIFGVGGEIRVTHTQVPSLTFGPLMFPDWFFSVVRDAPAFEGEDYDGLIGQDVLRNFDVYLDYPQSKIYFVPNDRYRERWGS